MVEAAHRVCTLGTVHLGAILFVAFVNVRPRSQFVQLGRQSLHVRIAVLMTDV